MNKLAAITGSEQSVLKFIKKYIETNGVSPSFHDIADNFDWYVGSANYRVQSLKKKGYINYVPGKYRTIRVLK
jgi:SOS-response transcriptional repressor LexA